MHELKKLAEAQYFYSMMCKEYDESEILVYNLSVFLAAARSVLQYALKEAENKSGGKSWYDNKVSVSPILAFFKDKRNVNIHEEPVKPVKHTSITFVETVSVSESVTVRKYDTSGNLLGESTSESIPKPEKCDIPPVYEDIVSLSEMYISKLKSLVDDGIKRGFIGG
jgi:hypothetical protein